MFTGPWLLLTMDPRLHSIAIIVAAIRITFPVGAFVATRLGVSTADNDAGASNQSPRKGISRRTFRLALSFLLFDSCNGISR